MTTAQHEDAIQWVSADQVFDGRQLRRTQAVGIQNGHICTITDLADQSTAFHHAGLLSPGFVDIQVNGGGGVMLNGTPTVDGIATIIAAHRRFGTTALLPTVITDAPACLEAAVAAAIAAKDKPGCAGLHIEGPHLSTRRRGTHAAQHIRPFSAHTLGLVQDLQKAGVPCLITVAPETTSAADVTALCDAGAVVSIGHSDATAAEATALLAAGAACFTHLFNAMSPMQSRAPGVTGAAIGSKAYCSIIADGIHVDPAMITLAIRARPVADRMIAVSDAMATVGGPDRFMLYGQDIHLHDERLVNAEGALAGAHLTMLGALQNLVSYGIDLETALRMGRTNPLALMGQEAQAALIGQPVDDILLFNPDLTLKKIGLLAEGG